MNIQDKLFRVRYNVDQGNPHIRLNKEICQRCSDKLCTCVCPADLYKVEENEVIVEWQGCLECGSCRISCTKGAIEWKYPKGGFGACFRFG